MLSVTKVMTKTLGELHKIIEKECDYKHPKETMVLMIGFINGVIFQIREKLDTLELGLGKQLLEAINALTTPEHAKTFEKLNNNDPSLAESASGISPDDFSQAITFLSNKLTGDLKTHLSELPLLLRNDDVLLLSLAFVVANIFQAIDNNDLDTCIDKFSENIRIFTKEKYKPIEVY